jgi:tellurite resistance protein
VALADGRVETTERDEVIGYIHGRQLVPTITQQRITKFFDQRVRDLQDRDFVHFVTAALRPVPALSLTADVIRIAERTAAADGQVDRNEAQVIRLIRLITISFAEPKLVEPFHDGSSDESIK